MSDRLHQGYFKSMSIHSGSEDCFSLICFRFMFLCTHFHSGSKLAKERKRAFLNSSIHSFNELFILVFSFDLSTRLWIPFNLMTFQQYGD